MAKTEALTSLSMTSDIIIVVAWAERSCAPCTLRKIPLPACGPAGCPSVAEPLPLRSALVTRYAERAFFHRFLASGGAASASHLGSCTRVDWRRSRPGELSPAACFCSSPLTSLCRTSSTTAPVLASPAPASGSASTSSFAASAASTASGPL